MKQSYLILIGLLFCQCSSDKTSKAKSSDKNTVTKEKSKELNTLIIDELPEKMSGKDAIEALKKTKDFTSDFKDHNLGFKLKIDEFANESDAFHYLRTICKDQNYVEKTISSYRINSNSGKIEKKNNTGEWQRIN